MPVLSAEQLELLIRAVQHERDNVLFGAATVSECEEAQPFSELLEILEDALERLRHTDSM